MHLLNVTASCLVLFTQCLVQIPVGAITQHPRSDKQPVVCIDPGHPSEISDGYQRLNGTNETQTLQLYPGAAKVGDGQFTALDGHANNDLASWTSVAPGAVT